MKQAGLIHETSQGGHIAVNGEVIDIWLKKTNVRAKKGHIRNPRTQKKGIAHLMGLIDSNTAL